MDRNIWETIANQCAPVLMDVKPSNLLILTRAEEAAFRQMDEIEGISCICLHSGEKEHLAPVPEGPPGGGADLAPGPGISGNIRIREVLL